MQTRRACDTGALTFAVMRFWQVNFWTVCLVFLSTGLLSACGSEQTTGNRGLNPDKVSLIQKGTATKEQVRALLGTPQSTKTQIPVYQPPGTTPLPAKQTASEIWAYWANRVQKQRLTLPLTAPGKAHQSSYTVIVYFDAHGVVLDCQTQEGHY